MMMKMMRKKARKEREPKLYYIKELPVRKDREGLWTEQILFC